MIYFQQFTNNFYTESFQRNNQNKNNEIHERVHMKGYMLRAIWEFAQSADCIAQTERSTECVQSADWQAICRLRKLLNHKYYYNNHKSQQAG